MKKWRLYSDKEILDAYKECGSINRTAKKLGVCGIGLSKRLRKLGIDTSKNYKNILWNKEEDGILLREYTEMRDKNQLSVLAEKMGRSVKSIYGRAKRLGLVDRNYKLIMTEERHNNMSNGRKRYFEEHPECKNKIANYMKNHVYSEEERRKFSELTKKRWQQENSPFRTEEYHRKQKERLLWMREKVKKGYTRGIESIVSFGDREYRFRSSWEKNLAFYFEYLKVNKIIYDWYYENDIFRFPKNEYGIISYKPDFLIYKNEEDKKYIELKGWLDEKSLKRLELMTRFYPSVDIELYDEKKYNEIKSEFSNKIPWDDVTRNENKERCKCKIEGCDNPARTRGLCKKHYAAWWRKHCYED